MAFYSRINMKKITKNLLLLSAFALMLWPAAIFAFGIEGTINPSGPGYFRFGAGDIGRDESSPFTSGLLDVGSALPAEYVTQEADPIMIINRIIKVALSLLGIGTLALMLYAGAIWMTAGGSEEKVADAKKTLKNALIGLVLVTMAYSLTVFVGNSVLRASGSGYGGGFFSGFFDFFG